MTQPAVELTDVSKRYGEVQALRDVSMKIEPGEVVAMLGPNGAGKTTSISIMLGVRNPTSGTTRLFGLDPKDLRARSRIGVMQIGRASCRERGEISARCRYGK